MNILLTNDDGITAEGLTRLCRDLCELGNVFVAAPRRHMSAASHCLSLDSIDVSRVEVIPDVIGYSIDGTPADCVKLAILELVEEPIDLVVSGINDGANLGVNIWYSGTVAAAREAFFYGIPAIAVSTRTQGKDFDNFTAVSRRTIELIRQMQPVEPGIYNINIPFGSIEGIKVTEQSRVNFREYYRRVEQKDGLSYRVMMEEEQPSMPETDADFFERGFITITPLTIAQTDYAGVSRLAEQLEESKLIEVEYE